MNGHSTQKGLLIPVYLFYGKLFGKFRLDLIQMRAV